MTKFFKKSHRGIFPVFLVLFLLPAFLYARDEDLNGDKETAKEEARAKNSNGFFDYSLEFTLQGSEVLNQSLYRVKSPAIGGGLDFEGEFGKNKKVVPKIAYSIFGEKFFVPVERSDQTLDSLDQKAEGELAYKSENIQVLAGLTYDYVYRPDWPDLYQPNPYLYSATYNPDDAKLEATNRYSYSRLTPRAELEYRIKKSMPLNLEVGYTRKYSKEDPTFDPTLPGHLTPDNYTKVYGDVSLKNFKKSRLFNYKISNTYYTLSSKDELARDRVTGKTHYSTTPNPLYKEWNNKTELELILNIKALNVKVRPSYAYRINTDTFQGYYSYTEHDIGMKISQRLLDNKLKWSVKGERRLRSYTSDGYGYYSATGGHYPLTDGSTLYKNYWIAAARISYDISRSLEIFTKYSMKKKDTNYPSYVPGVNPTTNISNPGTKNYDIDFSYTNQRFDAGVRYSI